MYYFAATHQTSTLKVPTFFYEFRTKERILRVKKSKITGGNTFNGENFDDECNHGASKDEITLFRVLLYICDHCFNTLTAKYVYLRFSSIAWFLQYISHSL